METVVRMLLAAHEASTGRDRQYRFCLIPGSGGGRARYDALGYTAFRALKDALGVLPAHDQWAAYKEAERLLDDAERKARDAEREAALASIPTHLIEVWSERGMRHSDTLRRYAAEHGLSVTDLYEVIDRNRAAGGAQHYEDGPCYANGSGYRPPAPPNCS